MSNSGNVIEKGQSARQKRHDSYRHRVERVCKCGEFESAHPDGGACVKCKRCPGFRWLAEET